MFNLCCIGHLTLDTIITPAHTLQIPGGTAYYFSHALANLEPSYQLITKLGAEEFHFVKDLTKENINVKVALSARTVHFENKYSTNTDHRTQRVLAVADPFEQQDAELVNASIIHLGPLLAGDMSAEFILQLAARSRLSLDVQGFLRKVEDQQVLPAQWPAMSSILPSIHYLKLNEMEIEQLTGVQDIQIAGHQIAEMGVQEVIVTLGSKGSMILSNGTWHRIPAYQPPAETDATGCGDTYMAGYLYQRKQGATIDEAGHFASAMAAIKMTGSGAFKGDEASVRHFIANTKTK